MHLGSGVMPLKKYIEKGIKLGLGTDVAGGPTPSILENIRSAAYSSRIIN